METKQWITMSKGAWGDGPWCHEPDKMQWTDEATGLPCLIVRSTVAGALCGYVGVTRGHPLFGISFGDIELDVHGGLTFSDYCAHTGSEAEGVCHVPGEGEDGVVWWLGFDCAHAFDACPKLRADLVQAGIRHSTTSPLDAIETYKDLEYVKAECAKLAQQVQAVAQ